MQTGTEDPRAGPLQFVVEGADLSVEALHVGRGEVDGVFVVVPNGHQILRHGQVLLEARATQADSRRARTGTMTAAAIRCVVTSTIFVARCDPSMTDGTHDSTNRAAVSCTN